MPPAGLLRRRLPLGPNRRALRPKGTAPAAWGWTTSGNHLIYQTRDGWGQIGQRGHSARFNPEFVDFPLQQGDGVFQGRQAAVETKVGGRQPRAEGFGLVLTVLE